MADAAINIAGLLKKRDLGTFLWAAYWRCYQFAQAFEKERDGRNRPQAGVHGLDLNIRNWVSPPDPIFMTETAGFRCG
jgi:hypothetical protein